ncbi:MAG: DUF2339 domain-containing protein [Candidatus Limnocylindria bacterium]
MSPWIVGIAAALIMSIAMDAWMAAILLGVGAGLVTARIEGLERRVCRLEERSVEPTGEQAPEAAALPISAPATTAAPSSAAPAPAWPAPAPPAESPPSAAHVEDRPRSWDMPSLADIEGLLAGRLLALVGGLALIIGVVFFLGLAFSRGWIGPEARVVLGAVAGIGMFGLGARTFSGRQRVVGHVLIAVGLAAISLSLFAATRLYGFVPPEIALLGTFVSAACAAVVAIRARSQVVAAYGLLAVLAGPPIMGAEPTLVTIGYLGTALIGITAISLYRDWRWLPALAFLLTAPQVASYLVREPDPMVAVPALFGFWALNALAAGGEEFRVRRNELSPTSATVLLGAAAILVWGGFTVLDAELERWRGLFLVTVALAHLALGAWFVRRETDRHPFGLLALATGIAALTMSIPVQLGGPIVPIAWAAEAAALTWVAAERRNAYSAWVAALLGLLAVYHLVLFEYPPPPIVPLDPDAAVALGGIPFASGRGAALLFVLGALAAAGWLGRAAWIRLTLGAVGVTLFAYVLSFELDGLVLLAAMALLAGATAVGVRRFAGIPLLPWRSAAWPDAVLAGHATYLAAGLAGLLAVRQAMSEYLPSRDLVDRLSSDAGFSVPDEAMLAGLVLVAVFLITGAGAGAPAWRTGGIVAAATAGAYLLPFYVPPAWTVIGWAALAASLYLSRGEVRALPTVRAADLLIGAGAILLLASVVPVERLAVDAARIAPLPLLNLGTLAMLAIAAGLATGSLRRPADDGGRVRLGIAAVIGVYLVSVAVVDAFQVQVGGGIALEELQEQGQLALSVLWAVLGGGGLAVGLATRARPLRVFALALLALATAKVFLIDLATLDVAYRVLSFIALGVLLLASAWVFFRLQPEDARNASR